MSNLTDSKNSENPIIHSQVAFDIDQVRDSGILNYRSESLPTWCPGCGYYGITLALADALNKLKVDNDKFVVVSGIGCAGRYPFFVNGYGFHSIHGRTLPIASGVKMARPDLTVLAVGGDGDGLAIGGGHLPHAIRRNVDMTYVLFDNGIYGLTKGQASPTTPQSQITKTSPYGNPESPLNPILFALACSCTFVAAGFASLPVQMTDVFIKAFNHKGFSFVVITTPCITFDHVNITYERMRDAWKPLPDEHNPLDLQDAFKIASDHNHYYGVIYQSNRPTWEEKMQHLQC